MKGPFICSKNHQTSKLFFEFNAASQISQTPSTFTKNPNLRNRVAQRALSAHPARASAFPYPPRYKGKQKREAEGTRERREKKGKAKLGREKGAERRGRKRKGGKRNGGKGERRRTEAR